MSKERARRRAAREKEAAVVAAARAATAERRERRQARRRAWSSRLPRRHSRPTGLLAERRRQRSVTLALALGLNVLLWVFVPDWSVRALVLAVTLLALPVLHTVLFRR